MQAILFAIAILLGTNAARADTPVPSIDTVGGRRVESVLVRHPTSKVVVVFENGARGTIDKWDKVIALTSPNASLFAYNRPGYGNSDAAASPRDGATIVRELRQLLASKGLKPPYVLVGHSLGGLYSQYFARNHPDEVGGLVLVDALYPRLVKKQQDFPLWTRMAEKMFFSRAVQDEIEQIHATGEAVLALPSIDHKPIIRLFNQPKSATAVGVDFGAFNTDPQTREFVRQLYPTAKKVIVDSSHEMQTQTPEAVAAAIAEVLARVE